MNNLDLIKKATSMVKDMKDMNSILEVQTELTILFYENQHAFSDEIKKIIWEGFDIKRKSLALDKLQEIINK